LSKPPPHPRNPDHGLKSGELGTSEGVDILKNPTAEELQPAGTGKKGKEASAPEGGDLGLKLKEASTLGGEILKKRKEAMAALDLLFPTAKKAQPAGVKKKRKKVVKKEVRQDVIDSIISKPLNIVQELSDEDLADQPQEFRKAYNRVRLLNDKVCRYEQALIQ
jgi:seryl-tRNA synthetase